MPLDTFTYYLLKVGFIPPLRAHWVLGKIGMKSSRLILMIMALAILCSFLGVLVP